MPIYFEKITPQGERVKFSYNMAALWQEGESPFIAEIGDAKYKTIYKECGTIGLSTIGKYFCDKSKPIK